MHLNVSHTSTRHVPVDNFARSVTMDDCVINYVIFWSILGSMLGSCGAPWASKIRSRNDPKNASKNDRKKLPKCLPKGAPKWSKFHPKNPKIRPMFGHWYELRSRGCQEGILERFGVALGVILALKSATWG